MLCEPTIALCNAAVNYRWQTFARDIINATGLQPNTTPTLILASFAHSDNGAGGFSPQMLYQRGVLSGPLGNYISVFVPISRVFAECRV